MKKLISFACFSMILVLAACSSSVKDELVDYQNNYVKHVNSKVFKLQDYDNQINQEQDPKKIYNILTKKSIPLLKQVKDYLDSVDVKSDEVKKLHQIRQDQFDDWLRAYNLKVKAIKYAFPPATETDQQKFKDTVEKVNQYAKMAQEKGSEYDKKVHKLADKYNVKLKKTPENPNK